MDHEDYKEALLADPGHPTSAMLDHVAGCRDCQAYTERVMLFENRLERALRVDVPGVAMPASRPRAHRLRRGLAVAASILVVVTVAGGVWLGSAGRTLAAAVVGHMAGEPGAWVRTEVAVPFPKLEKVMADSNMRLRAGAGLVSYANSCAFRGHQVPHLVVQTNAGAVTVMVLTHESVHRAVHFDEQGYRGMIIPVPEHGSLALLEQGTRGDAEMLKKVAAGVLAAIEWNP